MEFLLTYIAYCTLQASVLMLLTGQKGFFILVYYAATSPLMLAYFTYDAYQEVKRLIKERFSRKDNQGSSAVYILYGPGPSEFQITEVFDVYWDPVLAQDMADKMNLKQVPLNIGEANLTIPGMSRKEAMYHFFKERRRMPPYFVVSKTVLGHTDTQP